MSVPKEVLSFYELKNVKYSVLHIGENTSFKVCHSDSQHPLVIKRLRNDRSSSFSAEAELSWLLKFKASNTVVQPWKKNIKDNLMSYNKHTYATYRWFEGKELNYELTSNYMKAGQILKSLHLNGEDILLKNQEEWSGQNRPTYDVDFTVWSSLENILKAKIFDFKQIDRIKKYAELIASKYPTQFSFIHGDFHLGNLIKSDNTYLTLDFDECGFGPLGYDVGTLYLHTMINNRNDHWQAFLKGYGGYKNNDLKFLISARILFLTGKIPLRLDVPELKENAEKFMNLYVDMINKVLTS